VSDKDGVLVYRAKNLKATNFEKSLFQIYIRKEILMRDGDGRGLNRKRLIKVGLNKRASDETMEEEERNMETGVIELNKSVRDCI
jgi:hypothetical protein